MEVVAMFLVVVFLAGGKSEDTSMKMMLISKMFMSVAVFIFTYVSLLYANYAISSKLISTNSQNLHQKTESSISRLQSFLHIDSLNELHPYLILLAVSAGAALIMYLISRYFRKRHGV